MQNYGIYIIFIFLFLIDVEVPTKICWKALDQIYLQRALKLQVITYNVCVKQFFLNILKDILLKMKTILFLAFELFEVFKYCKIITPLLGL